MNCYHQRDRNLVPLFNASEKANGKFVLRLKKSSYGLKKSAKQWHSKLKSFLEECGFDQGNDDPCLLYQDNEHGERILFWFTVRRRHCRCGI